MSRFAQKTENKKEAGLALIWVLMVLAVTSALSLAFLQKVSIGISTTGTRSDSIQAQYLAEAAANHAMWSLINEPDFPASEIHYYMHSLGNGRYGYKVRRHTNTTFATVAVVGGVGDTVVRQSYVIHVSGGWYDRAWKYRQKISISANVADSDLVDFPYMVKIDAGNGLFMNAQLDGDDILFTDSDKLTKLDHELEKYTSLDGTEKQMAWVKLPLLSSSDATEIYMYYGNHAAKNQENTAAAWSNDYESVYHLHDDFNDSVGDHNGSNTGSIDVAGPMYMADAQDFNPADGVDYIDIGNWRVSGDKLTIQAWIRSDDEFAQKDPWVIAKANGIDPDDYVWGMGLTGGKKDEKVLFYLNNGSGTLELVSNSKLSKNTWHHVALTYDGSWMRIIKNGWNDGTGPASGDIRDNLWLIQIGNNPSNPDDNARYSWDGKIDEVRISKVNRSEDWMRAEYRNQGSPPTYLSLETEEERYLGDTIPQGHFDFESDNEGFVYWDDKFRGTSEPEPDYASGDRISSGGYPGGVGGALMVQLGGIDNDIISGMSGGWEKTFNLTADSNVSISFVYKLTMAANYESDENSQVLVSVDGTLYGERNWWDIDWLNRTKITFDNTNSAENLTDFPVLVSLTADDVDFDKIKLNGADIRFVDDDGTLLNHEIEAWDDTQGSETATVWVKVPQIDAGSTTDNIFMYYNNSDANDASGTAAWASSYQGVWHLNEATGDLIKDTTDNTNTGTSVGGTDPVATPGIAGGAFNFNAGNDWFEIGADPSLDLSSWDYWTISAWINPSNFNGDKWPIIYAYGNFRATLGLNKDEGGTDGDGQLEHWRNNSSTIQGDSPSTLPDLNQWNQAVVVRDPSATRLYLNGNEVGSGASDITGGPQKSYIGGQADYANDSGFLGLIDEVRISGSSSAGAARSADWIEASYLSQNGTFAFCTFSGEGIDDYVARIAGDGNGGSDISTGWKRFRVDLGTLTAGDHTFIIGGYNNKKTATDERTEIIIDDVIIWK